MAIVREPGFRSTDFGVRNLVGRQRILLLMGCRAYGSITLYLKSGSWFFIVLINQGAKGASRGDDSLVAAKFDMYVEFDSSSHTGGFSSSAGCLRQVSSNQMPNEICALSSAIARLAKQVQANQAGRFGRRVAFRNVSSRAAAALSSRTS